jgi:hypothetical protein
MLTIASDARVIEEDAPWDSMLAIICLAGPTTVMQIMPARYPL